MDTTQNFEESGHIIGIPARYLHEYADALLELGPRATVALIERPLASTIVHKYPEGR